MVYVIKRKMNKVFRYLGHIKRYKYTDLVVVNKIVEVSYSGPWY